MAKKFLVWKDANCNGENIEWVELTGAEFKKFIDNPKNACRRIIVLTDNIFYEDDEIFIEATEEQYTEWLKEKYHSIYIRREEKEKLIVSISSPATASEEYTYEEILSSTTLFEFCEETDMRLMIQEMFIAIEKLSKEDQKFIQQLLVSKEKGIKEADIAASMNIPRTTFRSRKEKIFKRIKKLSSFS